MAGLEPATYRLSFQLRSTQTSRNSSTLAPDGALGSVAAARSLFSWRWGAPHTRIEGAGNLSLPRVDPVRSPARGSRFAKIAATGGTRTRILPGSAMSRFAVGLRRHCYFADGTRTRLPGISAIELRLHEKLHEDALSVADWIRLSRFEAVRASRRCTAKLVRLAALLSLSGGWLAVRTAESSREARADRLCNASRSVRPVFLGAALVGWCQTMNMAG